jgi:hypothetical protein
MMLKPRSPHSLFNTYLGLRRAQGDHKSLEAYFRPTTEKNSADSGEVVLPRYEWYNEQAEIPDRTIVIPIEVMQESMDNVLNVLALLERECSRSFKGKGRERALKRTEVILWFNSEGHELKTDDQEEYRQAMEAYAETAEMVQWWFESIEMAAFYSSSFRLHLFHSYRRPGENFNNIRSDYMDVILRRALFLGYPLEHPVHWIDANTPFISRGAIDRLETALREHKGYLVKANLQLSPDQKLDRPLACMPQAEKVAIVYSVGRRILERNQLPTASRGYVEEPGLSMELGVYLRCGGIGTTNPLIGESRTLIQRIVERLDPSIPPVWYENYARIGKTDRRFVLLAYSLLPKRLAGSQAWAVYESFTEMINRRPRRRTRRLYAKDLIEMLKIMEEGQVELTGVGFTDSQWRRLEILITQHLQFADH